MYVNRIKNGSGKGSSPFRHQGHHQTSSPPSPSSGNASKPNMMADIFQTRFWNTLCWKKKDSCVLFLVVLLTNYQRLRGPGGISLTKKAQQHSIGKIICIQSLKVLKFHTYTHQFSLELFMITFVCIQQHPARNQPLISTTLWLLHLLPTFVFNVTVAHHFVAKSSLISMVDFLLDVIV